MMEYLINLEVKISILLAAIHIAELQVNCGNRPLSRRNYCISYSSLAPFLPPSQLLIHLSPVRHFRLPIARQRITYPGHSSRKMGWKLLPCCFKTWYRAKATFCNPPHHATPVLAVLNACTSFWNCHIPVPRWRNHKAVSICAVLHQDGCTSWRRIKRTVDLAIWELLVLFQWRSFLHG